MIPITFLCTHSTIDPARIGQPQTVYLKSNDFDPPELNVDYKEELSRGGQAAISTVFGHYYAGTFRVSCLFSAELPYLQEFLWSCGLSRQPFLIDATSVPDIGVEFEARLTDKRLSTPRIHLRVGYKSSFDYRCINNSYGV